MAGSSPWDTLSQDVSRESDFVDEDENNLTNSEESNGRSTSSSISDTYNLRTSSIALMNTFNSHLRDSLVLADRDSLNSEHVTITSTGSSSQVIG